MPNSFGEILKTWRNQRRLSQLDLGLIANVSARHISFLETGRSKPSRAMTMQLCETLAVPLQDRTSLIHAAGYSSPYQARSLDAVEMQDVRQAINWMLKRHEPYPAFLLDRHWQFLETNGPAKMLLGATGLHVGDSILDFLMDVEKASAVLENWQEVIQHTLIRLRTENTHFGSDPVLENAISRLSELLEDQHMPIETNLPPLVPTRYRLGDKTLSLFSTIAQFGTAEDLTLAELKIEMVFPADEASRQFFESLK
ncbi:MAG: helix-turn-helix transcriptional regulator [Pseudomonadota bacterium]